MKLLLLILLIPSTCLYANEQNVRDFFDWAQPINVGKFMNGTTPENKKCKVLIGHDIFGASVSVYPILTSGNLDLNKSSHSYIYKNTKNKHRFNTIENTLQVKTIVPAGFDDGNIFGIPVPYPQQIFKMSLTKNYAGILSKVEVQKSENNIKITCENLRSGN